jgi:hypothetical protein
VGLQCKTLSIAHSERYVSPKQEELYPTNIIAENGLQAAFKAYGGVPRPGVSCQLAWYFLSICIVDGQNT